MENLLTTVYFLERCNACGDTYPITLDEVFREQNLDEGWQTIRPCEGCAQPRERLVAAIPAQELAGLAQAWETLAAALHARGLTYHVGRPPVDPGRAVAPQSRGT